MATRFEHAVRREITRRDGQKPSLRILRKLFAALGDLLFWAHDPSNPASIHHVALFLGNNQVIHAPDTGDVVKISTVWQQGLVGTVTRPGA